MRFFSTHTIHTFEARTIELQRRRRKQNVLLYMNAQIEKKNIFKIVFFYIGFFLVVNYGQSLTSATSTPQLATSTVSVHTRNP